MNEQFKGSFMAFLISLPIKINGIESAFQIH